MDEDSIILSRIFSPEVWMLVFETFRKRNLYNDIQNGINSSLYFRKIMETRRTTVLFPLVFEMLAHKYERGSEDAFSEEPRDLTNVEMRRIYQDLSSESDNDDVAAPPEPARRIRVRSVIDGKEYPPENSIVLKLRMVCRTWNTGVDQFYQTLPYHYKMNHDFDRNDSTDSESDDDEEDTSRIKSVAVNNTFVGRGHEWSLEQFICRHFRATVKYLEHFESTHSSKNCTRSPFVGRAINIRELSYYSSEWNYYSASPTPDDQVFWDTITSILQKYGHYIWYCDLSTRNKFPSLVEYYRMIREWISLMPNLKVLDISYPFKMPRPNYPNSRELRQLQREIRSNPLPKLKQLTLLKTHKIPAPIFNELMNQNSSGLQMLEISKNKFQGNYDIFSASVQVPMLKKLSMQSCDENELSLLIKSSVKWNLETLYIDFDEKADFIEWSKVFKAIEAVKCSETINNLMIDLPIATSEMDQEELLEGAISYRLYMPFVKRLKLVISNQVKIDFILPMKNSLEVLELYFGYRIFDDDLERKRKAEEAQQSNPVINFVGFENRLMESNIWELFPRLKRIYVENKRDNMLFCHRWTGKRENWEKKKKDGNN